MAAFIFNKKIGTILAILFWLLSIVLFLLNIGSLLIIIHLPTVLLWAYNLLMISFLFVFLCGGLFILAKKAPWKSRVFFTLLIFSALNILISSVVFFKSKSIEENSTAAKESLTKAMQNINKQLQKTKESD